MSNTFQRTFQHLVDANTVLQSVIPPLPPLQRAPTQAPTSLPAPSLSPPCGQHSPRHSLELRLMAATSTSARQSSGMSTNLATRPSMKQSLLILPLVQRSTLLSTPGWDASWCWLWYQLLMFLMSSTSWWRTSLTLSRLTLYLATLRGLGSLGWMEELPDTLLLPGTRRTESKPTWTGQTRLFLPLLDIREVHIFKSCSNSSIFELICGS